jgi:hypothetical protein
MVHEALAVYTGPYTTLFRKHEKKLPCLSSGFKFFCLCLSLPIEDECYEHLGNVESCRFASSCFYKVAH